MDIQVTKGLLNEQSEGSITAEVKLNFNLFENELIKIIGVSCGNCKLTYGFASILKKEKIRKIPLSNIELKWLDNNGVANRDIVLNESDNINISLLADGMSGNIEDWRQVKIPIQIKLSNGVDISIWVTLKNKDGIVSGKCFPSKLFFVKWFLNYSALIVFCLVILTWLSLHENVYNPINIDRHYYITIICIVIAYFGVPNLDGFKIFNLKFFKKLKARLLYPEFYFDQMIVKLIGNWFFVVILAPILLLLWAFYDNYSLYEIDLPKDVKENRFVIIPIESAVCDSIVNSGQYSCNNSNISQSDDEKLSMFFGMDVKRVIDKIIQFLYGHDDNKVGMFEKIYKKDIESVCLAAKLIKFDPLYSLSEDRLERKSDTKYHYCLATLRLKNGEVTFDEISYHFNGGRINLIEMFSGNEYFEIFRSETDPVRPGKEVNIISVISGVNTDIFKIKLIDADNTKSISIKPKGVDIDVFRKYMGSYDYKPIYISSNIILSFEKYDINLFVNEVNLLKERSVRDFKYVNGESDWGSNWTLEEVFDTFSYVFDKGIDLAGNKSYVKFSKQNDLIKSNTHDFYLASSHGKTIGNYFEVITKFFEIVSYYAKYYPDENMTMKTNFDDFHNQMSSLFNKHFPAEDCKIYSGVVDFCDTSRKLYAELMYWVLNLDDIYEFNGESHDLVLEYIIKDDSLESVRNYLILSYITETLSLDKIDYFIEHYNYGKGGLKADLYGCAFKYVNDNNGFASYTTYVEGKLNNKIIYNCDNY
ncbi:hypothetical protein [Vibrio hippocampi]|uniref:Uncharacterized protein n=1 Tax=Vibrio hippocampi TaxID=654686 RepID=A0ABN8DNZ2_9VIBR|nr:hypothetical protein [Vibrio hippocampi]CAH0529658.1 hypothetical protein VHP8226_03413 [Vibrio hippocampi]